MFGWFDLTFLAALPGWVFYVVVCLAFVAIVDVCMSLLEPDDDD